MNTIDQVNAYFREIRNEKNFEEIDVLDDLSNNDKIKLYEYLKSNNILYAGGEMNENDVVKVRNVLIKLWIKSTENNKKYSKKA